MRVRASANANWPTSRVSSATQTRTQAAEMSHQDRPWPGLCGVSQPPELASRPKLCVGSLAPVPKQFLPGGYPRCHTPLHYARSFPHTHTQVHTRVHVLLASASAYPVIRLLPSSGLLSGMQFASQEAFTSQHTHTHARWTRKNSRAHIQTCAHTTPPPHTWPGSLRSTKWAHTQPGQRRRMAKAGAQGDRPHPPPPSLPPRGTLGGCSLATRKVCRASWLPCADSQRAARLVSSSPPPPAAPPRAARLSCTRGRTHTTHTGGGRRRQTTTHTQQAPEAK